MDELTDERDFAIGVKRSAKYTPSDDPMHRYNPYIEALNPVLGSDKANSLMQRKPAYSEEERLKDDLYRVIAVQRMSQCLFPLPVYAEIYYKFERMIRGGYVARNPLASQWVKQMKSGFPTLDWERDEGVSSSTHPQPSANSSLSPFESQASENEISENQDYTPLIRPASAGFSILGNSGVGKTTVVETVLSLFPQVITHSMYEGHSLPRQQLVWLKLECPFNGHQLGLCRSFIYAVDAILGTDYAHEYLKERVTTDYLIPKMAEIAKIVALGALVIDEIQRLKGSKESETLLNFFVQLTNDIHVPVVLIGTYKALGLISKELESARRYSGQGDVIIGNLAQDDEWDYFLKKLWRYQWTKEETPLTPPLSEAIYNESAGIVDIAVKLYLLMQLHVIGTGNELMTPKLVREVARENLHSVQPIIRAIRENKVELLLEIDDVLPIKEELQKYIANAARRVTLTGALSTLENEAASASANAGKVGEIPAESIAVMLTKAGYPLEVALKSATQACNRFATEIDLKLATTEAFSLAAQLEGLDKADPGIKAEDVEVATSPRHKSIVSLSGDLREIVAKAPKGMTPYDALKEAGVIKSPLEFLADDDL